MRLQIPNFRFALMTTAALTAAVTSTANAQVQIFPAESPAGVSNGLPVEMSNGLPIGEPEATGGVYGEQQMRFDSQHPWMHGYWQEMPAYGGFGAFRPYNYKHVLSQSQAAGGWGMAPTMPYSQQFWHRYRQNARMRPQINGTPYRTPPTMQSTGYGRAPQYPPMSSGPQLRFPRR